MANPRTPAERFIGKKIGYITVLEEVEIKIKEYRNGRKYWVRHFLCRCICDKKIILPLNRLNRERSRKLSCGCKRVTKHRLYRSWSGMVSRCNSKLSYKYDYYGGRGIEICQRWKVFENFVKDMDSTFFPGATLDRIDNNKGYFFSNCRWVTIKDQQKNRSNSLLYEYDGKVLCLKDICRILNKSYSVVYLRLKRGIPFDVAISKPCGLFKERKPKKKYKNKIYRP